MLCKDILTAESKEARPGPEGAATAPPSQRPQKCSSNATLEGTDVVW